MPREMAPRIFLGELDMSLAGMASLAVQINILKRGTIEKQRRNLMVCLSKQ
jgi:hypothetical protein